MNKKQVKQAEAVATLKEWGLTEGTEILAKVNKVSSSGMSRRVSLYCIIGGSLVDITYWAADALEWGYKDGYNGGISVSGCGMDMLFHTVMSLSYAMGYGPLNQSNIKGEDKGLRYRAI